MSERQYSEAEVAAIFERASEEAQPASSTAGASEGMTLTQLQEIGAEVGISAESIAVAASSIERVPDSAPSKFLGFQRSVARTVQLDRELTENEWERLVVELRETFNARGSVAVQGSLRQWTNGNLQVLLEPTATGQRIRFRTFKNDSAALMGLGVVFVAAAAVILAVAAMLGWKLSDGGILNPMLAMGAAGAVMFASNAFRLPGWVRTRRHQFDEIAAWITRTTKAHPPRLEKQQHD